MDNEPERGARTSDGGALPFPMVSIPAGRLQRRDARSEAVREVDLGPFGISPTSVTRAQWERVDGSQPAEATEPGIPVHPVTWFEAVRWCNLASRDHGLEAAYAVEGRTVRWNPAADGYRLPTEAEWEFACRAGTSTPTYAPLQEIAWTSSESLDGPQSVGLKVANSFGLFDMIGNVWEWCWDFADTARYGDYRSLRGGGWDDKAWSCRASVRRGSAPDAVLEDVGFRVARGAVGERGETAAQGWSAQADRERAAIRGPLPMGWTPLRRLVRD